MNPKPAVLALLACCSSAFALIGEDAKQIEGRYGKPMRVVAEHGNYRHVGYASHGFMILVEFLDGISKGEEFARPDKSNLSSDVVKQILALSADKDQTWRDLPPKDGDRFWSRSDGKAMAIFPAQGNFFIVQDPNFVEPQ
jgi:hypothetical protein